MNISKYTELLLEEKISKKTNKTYYCISIRFKDFTFPLLFISKAKYDEMVDTLSK